MYRNKALATIAGLMLVISLILYVDFSRVDDVPYHKTVSENVVTGSMFVDSNHNCDSVSEESLLVEYGEGKKAFSAPIDLQQGDSCIFSFNAVKKLDENAVFQVGLYDGNTNDSINEKQIVLSEAEGVYTGELQYYESPLPENCRFGIVTDSNTSVEIKDIQVDLIKEVKNGNRTVGFAMGIMAFCSIISALFFAFSIGMMIRKALLIRQNQQISRIGDYGDAVGVAVLFTIILITLVSLYRDVNILLPLKYQGGDEMGIYYLVKTISKEGITLVNQHVGGIYGGDMFDYPYCDKLSFLFIKILSLFTNNVYLTTNLFYFLNFFLNGFAAYYVCRKIGFTRKISVTLGVLFAFCPFIQLRYSHMWLTPLYTLPLACMIALNIAEGRYLDQFGKPVIPKVFKSSVLAFICAFTGFYYAYFTCAMVSAAFVIHLVNKRGKGIKGILYPVTFIGFTILGVIVNVLPNFLYWFIHGMNTNGEFTIRSGYESEYYGLKLIQLILPRIGHRIEALAALNDRYTSTYPLINENTTSSIGMIASIGLILAVLYLFRKKEADEKGRGIACLIICSFLISTVGGLGSVISLVVNIPMRCYNRMSTVIMFLSLLCIGVFLEQVEQKKSIVIKVACPLIIIIGILDQTVPVSAVDLTSFFSTRGLLEKVDEQMNDGNLIFQLPVDTWPSHLINGSYKQFIGYIETDGLNWSFGSMEGREESDWQMNIAEKPTAELLDILQYNGYDGVYMDSTLYDQKFGRGSAVEKTQDITAVTGIEPEISDDGDLFFWDIRNAG